MSKATDKLLGELHGKLAQSMMDALRVSTSAVDLLDEYHDELPDKVVDFLSEQSKANPALLTAVSKFLKDNNITCAIEDTQEMSELASMLKNKQRKQVGNVIHMEE